MDIGSRRAQRTAQPEIARGILRPEVPMAFTQDEVQKNREYFAEKLRAERQFMDVQHWVNKDPGYPELVLVDTRARDAFAKAHIPGAINVPVPELAQLVGQLPRDKELATYCWSKV
jgi:3-mercaptopyruvate sulfurtransferase SseA